MFMVKALVFLVACISQFDFNVVSFCTYLLKILQFLSSATEFLVFLNLFDPFWVRKSKIYGTNQTFFAMIE